MQNCNISPGTMTEDSPLTAERYPYYLYNARTDGSNPRGRRANELLSSMDRLTTEQAVSVANDTCVYGEWPWRAALVKGYERHGASWPQLAEGVQLLRGWDGRADKDSLGMTLFRAWWLEVDGSGLCSRHDLVQGDAELAPSVEQALLAALDRAIQQLRQQHGRLQVPWGDVYRARRGEESWPVSGVAGEAGLVTLRAVGGGEPDEEGVSYIESGQSCTTVVILEEGDVRSYSVVPYGQSEDPGSPHYTDQGRLLFSQEKLKDTWFARHRLDGHVESRLILDFGRKD
jgi:acyl-homoserine-lactone acylase